MGTGKETSSRELRTWFGDFPNAIGNAIGALLTTCLNFAVVLTVPQCILHRQRRRVSEAGDDVAVDVISSGQSPAASRQRMAWRGTQAASSSVRRSAPALASTRRPWRLLTRKRARTFGSLSARISPAPRARARAPVNASSVRRT